MSEIKTKWEGAFYLGEWVKIKSSWVTVIVLLLKCVVLEFVYVLLYAGYLPDLHKKFQVASLYDKDLKYRIWISASFFFWIMIIVIKFIQKLRETTWNKLTAISSYNYLCIWILLNDPVDKVWKLFILCCVCYMFLRMSKMYVNFITFINILKRTSKNYCPQAVM